MKYRKLFIAIAIVIILLIALVITLMINRKNQVPVSNTTASPSASTSSTSTSPIVEVTCNSHYYLATVSSVESQNKSNNEIANLIIDKWLKSYKSEAVNKDCRLEDYTFQPVDKTSHADQNGIITENGDYLTFSFDYSVKPANLNTSDWRAGNGQEEGSWIKDKIGFASAKVTNGNYQLIGVGTGP